MKLIFQIKFPNEMIVKYKNKIYLYIQRYLFNQIKSILNSTLSQ